MIMVSEKIQLRKKASFSSDSEGEYKHTNFKSFLCHPKRMLKIIIKAFGSA